MAGGEAGLCPMRRRPRGRNVCQRNDLSRPRVAATAAETGRGGQGHGRKASQGTAGHPESGAGQVTAVETGVAPEKIVVSKVGPMACIISGVVLAVGALGWAALVFHYDQMITPKGQVMMSFTTTGVMLVFIGSLAYWRRGDRERKLRADAVHIVAWAEAEARRKERDDYLLCFVVELRESVDALAGTATERTRNTALLAQIARGLSIVISELRIKGAQRTGYAAGFVDASVDDLTQAEGAKLHLLSPRNGFGGSTKDDHS